MCRLQRLTEEGPQILPGMPIKTGTSDIQQKDGQIYEKASQSKAAAC